MGDVARQECPSRHDEFLPCCPLPSGSTTSTLPLLYLAEVRPLLVEVFANLLVGAVGEVGCKLPPQVLLVAWVDPITVLLIVKASVLLNKVHEVLDLLLGEGVILDLCLALTDTLLLRAWCSFDINIGQGLVLTGYCRRSARSRRRRLVLLGSGLLLGRHRNGRRYERRLELERCCSDKGGQETDPELTHDLVFYTPQPEVKGTNPNRK